MSLLRRERLIIKILQNTVYEKMTLQLQKNITNSPCGVWLVLEIISSKVGHTDLVFWCVIFSRSVRVRLQVSVCSGYDLCRPGLPKLDTF